MASTVSGLLYGKVKTIILTTRLAIQIQGKGLIKPE